MLTEMPRFVHLNKSVRGGTPCGRTCDLGRHQEKEVIVVHRLPPGTSKWKRIEHRMFSFISMNRKV